MSKLGFAIVVAAVFAWPAVGSAQDPLPIYPQNYHVIL